MDQCRNISIAPLYWTNSRLERVMPYKGLMLAQPLIGALKVQHRITISGSRSRAAAFFTYCFLLPVNGSINSFKLIWSAIWSSSSCRLMYSCICFLFRPTVSTKYPLAQKWRSPYLYFKFACRSKIISELFTSSKMIRPFSLFTSLTHFPRRRESVSSWTRKLAAGRAALGKSLSRCISVRCIRAPCGGHYRSTVGQQEIHEHETSGGYGAGAVDC